MERRRDHSRTVIITEQAPLPLGPYSQAIKVGNLVFVSGQIPLDPATGEVRNEDIKEATRLVFRNIEVILEAADSSLSKIVKASVFLKRLSDFPRVNAVFEEVFTEAPPARETVEVSGLPRDVDIEISVIASANLKGQRGEQ